MSPDINDQKLSYEELESRLNAVQKENKKLARQMNNMQNIFDSNKMVSGAQSNLSAVISAEKTRQEKYLGMLLASCPDIILLFDHDGRFAYCTDAFLTTTNIKSFGLINGRTYKDVFGSIVPEKKMKRFDAAVAQAMEENKTVSYDEVLDISRNSHPRNFSIQITSMRGDSGKISGFLALFHDLTDLLSAKKQAEKANRAKSDFLATVSHEIRTPMNAIIGLTDIVKKTPLNAQQSDYISNIQNSSQILLNLINDILDFSKIEAGKLDLVADYFYLKQLLTHMQSVFEVMFKQKNLNFICRFDPSLPVIVFGDEKRLSQILNNILNNSLKYTNKGHVIFSAYKDDDGMLRFDIEDSGIGIKEEDVPRLFKAFEQFDKVKNKKVVGTGLGLAITKRLSELMSGNLFVKSKYGQGSCFSVKVNLPEGAESDIKKEEVVVYEFTAPRAKVLLVDDIDINLVVASTILEDYKITADQAVNGLQAVDMVGKKDYDLILMDHMMPEMDGVEATQKIRAMGGKYSKIPIVALTANAVSGVEKMFLSNGFTDFLSKPIDRTALSACLLRNLPQDLVEKQ